MPPGAAWKIVALARWRNNIRFNTHISPSSGRIAPQATGRPSRRPIINTPRGTAGAGSAPGDLRHGSGSAVHGAGVYASVAGGGDRHQHGRPGPGVGQRVSGRVVADR